MPRSRWRTPRPAAALLAVSIALSACGGVEPSVDQPGPTGSSAPSDPPRPSPTDAPVHTPGEQPGTPSAPPSEPADELPGPIFSDPVEIAAALASPTQRLTGIVSLLAGLGIGVTTADGAVHLEADPSVTPALRLGEAQVRGLAEMAAEEDPRRVGFEEWHAGLAGLGLDLSAEDLALAYEETYFFGYESSFFADLVAATGIELSPDGTLTRLQAWLLLLDGFVVEPADRAGIVLATNHDERWGGASANLPRLVHSGTDLSPEQLAELLAHLEPAVRGVPLAIAPAKATAHEGHGAPGAALDLVLRFVPAPPPGDVDAITWLTRLHRAEKLPVVWSARDAGVLETHGELRDEAGDNPLTAAAASLTDDRGEVRLTYQPRQEEADGEGETVEEVVEIAATADLREIASRVWDLPPALLAMLHGERTVMADLTIEWHEIRGLRLEAVDTYDVHFDIGFGSVRRIGTDRFSGFLALQDDGTYRGIVEGTTSAAWREDILGQECATQLGGRQKLLAIAELARADAEGRDLRIRFYPAETPHVEPMQCAYELSRYEGTEYDPTVPRDRWLPAREYAPFNDRRITMADEAALPARHPRGGRATSRYTEQTPELGGGTWEITLEEVEP